MNLVVTLWVVFATRLCLFTTQKYEEIYFTTIFLPQTNKLIVCQSLINLKISSKLDLKPSGFVFCVAKKKLRAPTEPKYSYKYKYVNKQSENQLSTVFFADVCTFIFLRREKKLRITEYCFNYSNLVVLFGFFALFTLLAFFLCWFEVFALFVWE